MADAPRKGPAILVILAVLGLVLTAVLSWGEYDAFSLWSLYRQRKELARQVEELKIKNQALIDQIEGLKSNPELIEKIARENLGMSGKGETVYRILPEKPDSLPDSLKIAK
jgi:cell division protein FtsB